jgi:hypothetical protein
MPKHASHQWNSDTGRCNACDAHVLAFESNYRCIPTKALLPLDESPTDEELADWWHTMPEG